METEEVSALLIPSIFLLFGIPFGFLLAEWIHAVVALPRWLVEHASA